jgi:hypothetical protein
MTETKDFHIGDVLSIAPGRLVSPEHIGGVYKILEWMSGEEGLMTHQLPRVSRECEPYLIAQFPELTAEDVPTDYPDGMDDVMAYLATLYPKYGERVAVARIPREAHTEVDPIAELKMLRPDAPIIAVTR